ncbi:MAG: DUF3880 domain-containing protein [Lachnospiraceae bacterium]|nr:DUF3880 domain-containing protein [Lachnospiraceae bacterium]
MKILYYHWGENSRDDCVETMERLGHSVHVWSMTMGNYASDPVFLETLDKKLRKEGYDIIFSFDYFPLLSVSALDHKMPYISWVYDSPHLPLESETLRNPVNRVFVFDYALAAHYISEGFERVEYMPLPVNVKRLDAMLSGNRSSYSHEISFVGSLYTGEYNFYDQIGYLPDFIKGMLDGVIDAQERVYGVDLLPFVMTDSFCDEMGKYVKADLGPGFRNARNRIFMNMVRKKVTENERKRLLTLAGEKFNLDLYSGSKLDGKMPVRYMGTVDYMRGMPRVFSESRINLNITLRSILTGIPLRVVDIMGAGGFCLTNFQQEMAEYFENGREIVWFDSAEDMLDRMAYYLSHDSEREEIARAGHEAAARMFSYDVLLPKVLGD